MVDVYDDYVNGDEAGEDIYDDDDGHYDGDGDDCNTVSDACGGGYDGHDGDNEGEWGDDGAGSRNRNNSNILFVYL